MLVDDLYESCRSEASDINEHLPALKRYGEECETITEMGVRGGISTSAFLAARPKSLVSYDIDGRFFLENRNPLYQRAAEEADVDFQFLVKDVLAIEIARTDLLFIDTWHVYEQLAAELRLHAPRVRKYIVLHDTEAFRLLGEEVVQDRVSRDVSAFVSRYVSPRLSWEVPPRKGLGLAIEEFLAAERGWERREHFPNNNGLTILASDPMGSSPC